MSKIREELDRKLNNLSPEQLNSVCQFVEFLEYKQHAIKTEHKEDLTEEDEANLPYPPVTNEDIDRIVEFYRRHNKSLLIGLAKGEFTVPDDFNDPLPDEILDSFNNPQ